MSSFKSTSNLSYSIESFSEIRTKDLKNYSHAYLLNIFLNLCKKLYFFIRLLPFLYFPNITRLKAKKVPFKRKELFLLLICVFLAFLRLIFSLYQVISTNPGLLTF